MVPTLTPLSLPYRANPTRGDNAARGARIGAGVGALAGLAFSFTDSGSGGMGLFVLPVVGAVAGVVLGAGVGAVVPPR